MQYWGMTSKHLKPEYVYIKLNKTMQLSKKKKSEKTEKIALLLSFMVN